MPERSSPFESFAMVATILGFIVDSIAIVTILIATSLDEETPAFISPDLALGILVLAAFSYFGWLHSYWLENREKYNAYFSLFVIRDLMLDFQSPKHLFPLATLIVMFGLITFPTVGRNEASLLGAIGFFGGIGIFLGIIALVIYKVSEVEEKSTKSKGKDKQEKYNTFKSVVDENWEFWEKRIEIELRDVLWISKYSFQDLMITEEITGEGINYILAKYAKLHRDKTEYGSVFSREDDDFYRRDVLKNLELFALQDKYY